MPKTRSKATSKGASAHVDSEPTTTASTKTLAPSDANPPKCFILPKKISLDARIVTLPDPANLFPSRYLICQENGFYEFTKVAAPKKVPRSWLISRADDDDTGDNDEWAPGGQSDTTSLANGYLIKEADLFVATPIDPMFLLLPVLLPSSATKSDVKAKFLSLDDHFEALEGEQAQHLKQVFRNQAVRRRLEARLASICDSVDVGNERMYRLSYEKLLKELLQKAERMVETGLPASIEERFIQSALKAPIVHVECVRTTTTEITFSADESSRNNESLKESQDSTSTETSTSTAATSVGEIEQVQAQRDTITTSSAPPEVLHLQRLRTALNFHTSSYLPLHIRRPILVSLSASASPAPNFQPLDAHVAELARLRKEEAALRSLSDNITRKRSGDELDDEINEIKAQKKRKEEEEERKKKTENRVIKGLKKVDTSGMMKLSSFFGKGAKK